MRRLICLMSVVAAIAAASVTATRGVLAADVPQIKLTEWTPPDISTVGDDAFGKLVKYGYALMTDTANQIGPMVADPAKRYSGNNLTCQNCHLKAGTQPYAMPLTGVWGQFPQYRGREGEVGTLEDRINGCMERSMNGRALPLGSREMKAFLAFTKWVSTGIPDGAKLVGAGAMNVKEPGRAADLAHGQQVYAQVCATCHGTDGLGQRAADRKRLPVSAALGTRQLQQRRRHGPPPGRGCLRQAQHAVRHHLRGPGPERRGRL